MEAYLSKRKLAASFLLFAALISNAVSGQADPKTDSTTAISVVSSFQIGFLRLGLSERGFNSIFKDISASPIGSSGECSLYELGDKDIKQIYPWLDTPTIELTFSPVGKGKESVLTQMALILKSPETARTLIGQYRTFLGSSTTVNKYIEEWDLDNNVRLRISTYSGASSIFISRSDGICIDDMKK